MAISHIGKVSKYQCWKVRLATLVAGMLLASFSACSTSTVQFLEIPDLFDDPQQLFQLVHDEVGVAGDAQPAGLCARPGFAIARYSTAMPAVRIYVILNRDTGLVAVQFLEYGVFSFSERAEMMFQPIISRLRSRFPELREHTRAPAIQEFWKRLSSGQDMSVCS